MLFRQAFQRLAMGGHLARRFAAGNGPGMLRTHHHALKHGLAADQGLLAAFQCRQQLDGYQETPPGSQETQHNDWMILRRTKKLRTKKRWSKNTTGGCGFGAPKS